MLGVCYYPEHWPEAWWDDDARQMRASGITTVRIAEFAWSRIEPEPGRFAWGWLDRAIETLARHGLRVVMCTPTATPPKWLCDREPSILPVDEHGRVRGFGSRRHTTFSSPAWREESRRITAAVAGRYGTHDAVAAWQIDNEFGCHGTAFSYGPEDLGAFRTWLAARYGDVSALNEAWGNVFWSMEVGDFGEVALPVGAVTETNPAARLDYWRFCSEQIASYAAMQAGIIRAHSPGREVTHNFMGRFVDFDHWPVGRLLDVASWDSYPLGFTDQFSCDADERLAFTETGHPDMAAFHHDLYRAVGSGRFWVMEQQPGPVNWAPWNPVPKPGMVRLWTWEAFAHGAALVSYFRWRQAPFAQEQMHAGLQRPDRSPSPGGEEAAQVARELASLGTLPDVEQAPVALVFDYVAAQMIAIQPQGADFRYFELCLRWYEAARRWGVDVDIVRQDADLSRYAAVLVPSLPYVTADGLASLSRARRLLVGPRSGSKTAHASTPADLAPGVLRERLGVKVTQVASLRPELRCAVEGEFAGAMVRWREWLQTDASVPARFDDGQPAVVRNGEALYVAGVPDRTLLAALMGGVLRGVPGAAAQMLPEGVRLRRRGGLRFAFNYGPSAWRVPTDAPLLLGGRSVGPQEIACWKA